MKIRMLLGVVLIAALIACLAAPYLQPPAPTKAVAVVNIMPYNGGPRYPDELRPGDAGYIDSETFYRNLIARARSHEVLAQAMQAPGVAALAGSEDELREKLRVELTNYGPLLIWMPGGQNAPVVRAIAEVLVTEHEARRAPWETELSFKWVLIEPISSRSKSP